MTLKHLWPTTPIPAHPDVPGLALTWASATGAASFWAAFDQQVLPALREAHRAGLVRALLPYEHRAVSVPGHGPATWTIAVIVVGKRGHSLSELADALRARADAVSAHGALRSLDVLTMQPNLDVLAPGRRRLQWLEYVVSKREARTIPGVERARAHHLRRGNDLQLLGAARLSPRQEGIMSTDPFAILDDGKIADVLRRLHTEADRQMPGMILHYLPKLPRVLFGGAVHFDEAQIRGFYADKYIAFEREQAAFCHLTALSLRARTIVEFGSSFGISTIWLAAAAKKTGGRVIGTELVEEKAARARANVEAAGLTDVVEIRTGDAMQTLRESPSEIDLILNDGFPMLALDIVRLLRPRMQPGAVVLTDNVGTFKANYRDYLAFMRDRASEFRTVTLPFKSGTEYSVRVAPSAESEHA